MRSKPGSPDYCGHDLSHLFTLRVRVRTDRPTIIIHAFDGPNFSCTHSRIDVEVRMGGKVIFPRGATYCAVPAGTSTDGIDAKELVMSLVAMQPGDTDDEYFASYTPEQLAFAKEYGEALGCEREYRYCDENGNVRREGV
jgi:hypothetical protein